MNIFFASSSFCVVTQCLRMDACVTTQRVDKYGRSQLGNY